MSKGVLMSRSNTFNKLVTGSLTVAAIAVVSQSAFAHTRLETPAVVEGKRVHNATRISHGCGDAGARQPTYGSSVVFPNAISYTPIIGVDSGSGKVFTTAPASDFYSPLAGIGMLIRSNSPWDASNIKADSQGNVDGFWAGGKPYDQTISVPILVDFESTAVSIEPSSCARSVTFYPAIADVCDASVPSTIATDVEVLYWSPIPNFDGVPGQPFGPGHPYSNYDGYEDSGHTVTGHGWNSPASLKVTRSEDNPLPGGCMGNGGLGDDIYVYPSAEQINHELPVWSEPKQTGDNYWQ